MVAPHYRVLVLSEAFSDLHKILDHNKILDHIAAESPANAAAVVGQLWEALHSLADFPHRYAIKRHRNDPGRAVRLMPVPPFVVYYRIDERRKVVRIQTIRHGRQRRPRSFD